ncbi:imidazolonepropionase [Lysinibacillus sp. 2017]|uniref:amidohydrolase family protein n=1 Tax=unclassified Lysinibacillus TaxID=2636778 RepID=UPI000D52775E|nr:MULTISPECIES: amidohydrolase family protein [unclassified Lysinibacillus]AWE08802.1 imidazolonepropionase [Lysinibacillus sp. 2017]TGN36125.1 imidazolonepropionase [Lysinibacillus sp. S2017]
MRNFIIKNGTIIDVENGGSYVGSIEVERNMVKRIFKSDDVLPQGVDIVDAEGKYIIPGLIDMHCHINERFAPHFVASGVTTVRNTAGNVLLLKNLIEKPDDAPTPRVYASDRMIDGTPGQWGPTSYGALVTDDPEEARKEVRRQVEVGAKFVKLYGWIKREVMSAAVDEAKKYNLEVAIDLVNSKELTALDAAELGVDWIEHASGFAQEMYKGWNLFVDQEEWSHIDWVNPDQEKIKELCEKMLGYNVKLCPTMVIYDQSINYPEFWSPKNIVIESASNIDYIMQYWNQQVEHVDSIKKYNAKTQNLQKAIAKIYYDMGGTVVAGTDTPGLLYTYPGMVLHRELEIFVEIGFTELEALQAATVNAAKSINLDGIGVIREGAIADLVILNDNPLENIKHTQEIHTIVKGGKAYTQEEILSHVPNEEEVEKSMAKFTEQWESLGELKI